MIPTPQAIENAARAGEPCPGLKPCPFCGEKKIYFNPPAPEIDFLGSLNCPACLASMPNETNNVEELIGCWNHREPTDLGDMVLVPKAFLSRLREYKNQIDALYPRGAYDVELLFATACTTAWPVIDAMLAAAEDSSCK